MHLRSFHSNFSARFSFIRRPTRQSARGRKHWMCILSGHYATSSGSVTLCTNSHRRPRVPQQNTSHSTIRNHQRTKFIERHSSRVVYIPAVGFAPHSIQYSVSSFVVCSRASLSVFVQQRAHPTFCLMSDAALTVEEMSVVDVYDLASDIGKECEKIIDGYGSQSVTSLMPKVITVLELLEAMATRNESENTRMQELTDRIAHLESERQEKAVFRERFEKVCGLPELGCSDW